MRAASVSEADAQLKTWGLPSVYDGLNGLTEAPFAIELPVDCGRKAALARYLTYEVLGPRTAILYVFDDEVFEHEENTRLFDVWRQGLGETRSLSEAPGHVVEQSDALDTCALLSLCMYFVWSVAVFPSSGDLGLYISHDECLSILCPDQSRLQEIRTDLAAFGQKDQRA